MRPKDIPLENLERDFNPQPSALRAVGVPPSQSVAMHWPLLLALHPLPPMLARPSTLLLWRSPPPARQPLLLRMLAAPRRKGVESYQTVTIACSKCSTTLFRYKKKNGLKSSLVKCYIERISCDPFGLVAGDEVPAELRCPSCESTFARAAQIHGRPALKMVGGKVRMRK